MIIVVVVISLSALILVHELGHFWAAKIFGVKVEEFGLGFPPRLWGKRIGETVYSLNLLPFGGFVRIFGEDSEEKLPRSFSTQSISRRSVIVLSGVLMNVILGWFVFSLVFFAGAPKHLLITQVAPSSPAEAAGLKDGDIVLEVKKGKILLTDPVPSKEFIELVNRSPAETFRMKIRRGKEIIEAELAGRVTPPSGEGPLGISLVDIGFAGEPLAKSFVKGFELTVSTLKLVTLAFLNFFAKFFIAPEILETVAGPVGIFTIAAQAGSLGFVYLLELLAFISVNLAVLNLIPFPALDGGRFLLLIVEKLKGSPISRRIQVIINALGFAFLIILMILVTIQDIGRLLN